MAVAISSPLTLSALTPSFRLHLMSVNRSPMTIRCYLAAVEGVVSFLEREGLTTDVRAIKRAHLEAYFAQRLDEVKPSSVLVVYRALNVFWSWVVSEGEIEESPMARLHPPTVQYEPPPVLTDAEVVRLLATCKGRLFSDRRDMAIIRLLLDTGMRRGELSGLNVLDVDLQDATALEAGLPRLTAHTIVEPEVLREELRLIQERGYALDDRESHEYMRCISAPVFERDSPLRMGISISGPEARFTHEYLDGLREPMLRASQQLSRQLRGIAGE